MTDPRYPDLLWRLRDEQQRRLFPDELMDTAIYKIERLTAPLRQIRDAEPWCGELAEYGNGHDDARNAAAELAREAIGDE